MSLSMFPKYTIRKTCQTLVDKLLSTPLEEKFVECNYIFYDLVFMFKGVDSKGNKLEECPIELPNRLYGRACTLAENYDEVTFTEYVKKMLDTFLSFTSPTLSIKLISVKYTMQPAKIVKKYKGIQFVSNADIAKSLKEYFSKQQ